MIYEPEEDSLILKKYVEKYAKGKVLDMGTGSGIQAETAKKKTTEVIAVDINPEAVDLVKKKGIKSFVSDLFSNVQEKFDLIIFNPPYLPEDEAEDIESQKITTGGKKGFEIIERFLKDAKNHLEPNGKILIVCSSLTGDIESFFKKYNYEYKLLEKIHIFFEDIKVYLLKTV